MMKRLQLLAAFACLLTLGCDSFVAPSEVPAAEGEIRASIDNKPWSAASVVARQTSADGHFDIEATGSYDGVPRSLNLYLYNIPGPGTYPLGVWNPLTGGAATAFETFATPFNGAAGEVVVTSLTSTHIVGSFRFRAEKRSLLTLPSQPVTLTIVSVTDTLKVTEGRFNLPITNRIAGTIPDSAGGTAEGFIGSSATPFRAALGSALLRTSAPSNFRVTVGNEEYTVNVAINDYAGPGTYTFTSSSTERGATLRKSLTFRLQNGTYLPFIDGWSTQSPGGSGTITILSVTASRVRGHFSVNIAAPPEANTSTVVPVSVTFDVKRVSQ